jgi:tetratricopeptide (TPR) repeat protein
LSEKTDRFAPAAAVIFAIAFAVRLVHVWQLRSAPFFSVLMGDSRGYDEWARRIAGGDWFGHDVFYQAPLYPYFLGVLYAVAGRDLLLVRVIQIAIGSASCVLLALAARRLFSTRAGIAAGSILALYAPAIFFDGLLQKSVLDVFFVCLALWLIARIITVRLPAFAKATARPPKPSGGGKADTTCNKTFVRGVRLPWPAEAAERRRWQPDLLWLSLGLVMGGLSLTRENALVFIVVIVTWGVFVARVRSVAAFLIGLALVLVPVAARNTIVGGGFYVTTSQFGPNFYIGNNPTADGTYASLRYGRGAPEYERQDATELAELSVGRRLSPAEVSSYWTDRALGFITSQPGAWLELLARKVALVWNRAEMVDTEDQATHAEWSLPLRLAGPVAHFGVLVPLALLGLIVTWPMRSRLWVLYAMLVAYAASVALFYVFARYRYPLVPLLVLFAAAGIAEIPILLEKAPRYTVTKTAVARAAVVAATAVFTNWPILSTDFMRAVTENNLGAALQADQRLDEAAVHYQRAISLRPDYAPAYSNLGTALRARGRLDEAVASYERALQLRPDYPDAHYNLANALLDQGKSDAAVQHFQVALRSVPGSAEVHNNLGIALAAKGRHDEAAAEFQAALRADPNSAKAHRNLGDLLAASGRAGEAIDHFRRATDLAPHDGALRYDYGSVLLEAGRPAEAAAEFRAALKTMSSSVEAHNNLGIALGSQGKLDEAIEEFRIAIRIKPDFADAERNLAMALQVRRTRSGKR